MGQAAAIGFSSSACQLQYFDATLPQGRVWIPCSLQECLLPSVLVCAEYNHAASASGGGEDLEGSGRGLLETVSCNLPGGGTIKPRYNNKSVALVRERTIPAACRRSYCQLLMIQGCHVVSAEDPLRT
jgi:hypothetical protein